MTRRVDTWVALAGPMLLIVAVGIGASLVSRANQIHFLNALAAVAIVVAIYVFVGSTGVLSFGQISFVALGAFAAGVMTVPLDSKVGVLPDLYPLLRDHTISSADSLALAAAVGGVFAFLVGLPLMRLSGLAAGIATFAVLEITHNLLREWTKIGPGATTLVARPGDDRRAAGDPRRPARRRAWRSPTSEARSAGRRAPRGRIQRRRRRWESASTGSGCGRSRSPGALCGFAGGLLVHMLGSITTEQVYLELTFLTLAMLVVGGVTSLWGAVVGALAVSGLDSLLGNAEDGISVGLTLDLPEGSRLVILGALMALMLILRPSGITGGREFRLPRRRPA